MTAQQRANKEFEVIAWMTKQGYDRRASKDVAPIIVKYFDSAKMDLLEAYTTFLQKNGYIDSDATTEEPYAIDEFMKTQPK